jgi:hypothetical protein
MSNWHANRYRILVALTVVGLIVGLTARLVLSPPNESKAESVQAHFVPVSSMEAGEYAPVCAEISATRQAVSWAPSRGSFFGHKKIESGYVCMDYLAPNVTHPQVVTLKLTSQKHTLSFMKFWVVPESPRPQ